MPNSCKGCGEVKAVGEVIRDRVRRDDEWTHDSCLTARLVEISPSDAHRAHIMRNWSEPRGVGYDDMSASWQQGYDSFYEWESDDNENDEIPDVPEWCDAAEYHDGWRHADYENAYEGYLLAKGGPSDS